MLRRLESEGLVRRWVGARGKIVTTLVESGEDAAPDAAPPVVKAAEHAAIDRASDRARPAGSSLEQREAERVMLAILSTDLRVTLEPAGIVLPSGVRVEVDGANEQRTVLVECRAHQGTAMAAQKHKVLADTLKPPGSRARSIRGIGSSFA